MMIELTPEVNRAFSAGDLGLLKSDSALLKSQTSAAATDG